jgi:6-phosphogluconolactonase/glucosamine-6-phosphate isomerase/deaminase/LmbE family N-acetylglucosaminyl deacetylase
MKLSSFFQGALLSACCLTWNPQAAVSSHLSHRIYSTQHELAHDAAREIIQLIKENPEALLVLPTGSTPLPVYKELQRQFALDVSIDMSEVKIFFWDEYAGLEPHHPLRYSHYIEEEFLDVLGEIDPVRSPKRTNVNVPFDPMRTIRRGTSHEECQEEARVYEELFQQARQASRHKRVDLFLLGAGGAYPVHTPEGTILHGGHIGFNEPTESWQFLSTNVSVLSHKTRKDTEFRFRSLRQLIRDRLLPNNLQTEVPRLAVTLGIKNFLDDAQGPSAARVLALMTGEAKSPVVQQILEKGETSDFPVSIIHRASNALMMIDEDAAHLLRERQESTEQISLKYEQKEFQQAFDRRDGQRRILIVSPHPDDDVISMGIAIKRLKEWGHEIKVVTTSSGSNAVRLDVPADSLFSTLSEEQRSEWARRIRESESRQALRLLGLEPHESTHLNAEFYYRRGIPGIEAFSMMDELKARDLLLKFRPTDIFYAAENDPHGAHGIAFKLIFDAYQTLSRGSQIAGARFWGYRGAYAEWDFNQSGIFVLPFSEQEMELKIAAIKKHESQLNPLFPSFDPREFFERASDRNREAGSKWAALGRSHLPCAEVFKLISKPL